MGPVGGRVVRGPLLPADFVRYELRQQFGGRLGETAADRGRALLQRWWARTSHSMGPATAVRTLAEAGAVPLFRVLGLQPGPVKLHAGGRHATLHLRAGRHQSIGAVVTTWNANLDAAWRTAVRDGLELGAAWCLAFNGPTLRVIDARRSFARLHAELDLAACAVDGDVFGVLWAIARADAFVPRGGASRSAGPGTALLDEIVTAAARHGAAVSAELQQGVRVALGLLASALARRPTYRAPDRGIQPEVPEQALTLVYRILFLLYAEARLLVPIWHPIYRDSYSIEAIRDAIARGDPPGGLWETLQAISRLAHRGCHFESLQVAPFNGRLFAPDRTPLGERSEVSAVTVREVVLALTSRPDRGGVGRRRIEFGDLGVEQLGAIYERVLDDLPSAVRPGELEVRRQPDRSPSRARKATGTFYTPRSVTDFIVRRTLHPLVDGRRPEEILEIRVLDPAMGSGALLVASCRYLATAYERALIADGHCRPGDLDGAARAGFRRTIAQRCLFGVDMNPMAVQLARLSLWLATLSADLPLTFLDHNLREGNSLVGASPEDVARQAPGFARPRRSPTRELPLFGDGALDEALGAVVPARLRLALEPDNTVAAVRAKERALEEIQGEGGPLTMWKRLADLWCASWFWDPRAERPPASGFPDLAAVLRGDPPALRPALLGRWLEEGRRAAAAARCFHWVLEFPEVLASAGGSSVDGRPGFDAVVANPPWDMVRADTGSRSDRETERLQAIQLQRFVRESGIYRHAGQGHLNRYQLFIERGLSLLRPGGRFGFIAPWGLAVDHGSCRLRQTMLERCDTDTLVAVDNRRGIFPIHRGLRFALLAGTTGRPTRSIRARLGEDDVAALDALPDHGGEADAFPVRLSTSLLRSVAGAALAIPCARDSNDVALLERMHATHPPLGSASGWAATFGRELNASDDRRHFSVDHEGPLVVEGKHVSPFRVDLEGVRLRVDRLQASTICDPSRTFGRARLAYRDVASPTNRVTLIAAILPPGSVSTHTLFCLKTWLAMDAQWALCGLLNSFVANWLVRLWVTTHLGVAAMARLPVPRPAVADPRLLELASLAEVLGRSGAEVGPAHARLQALAAHLYGLSRRELDHVLAAFPLVPVDERAAVVEAFDGLARSGGRAAADATRGRTGNSRRKGGHR